MSILRNRVPQVRLALEGRRYVLNHHDKALAEKTLSDHLVDPINATHGCNGCNVTHAWQLAPDNFSLAAGSDPEALFGTGFKGLAPGFDTLPMPLPCYQEEGCWHIPCYQEEGCWHIPCYQEEGCWHIARARVHSRAY